MEENRPGFQVICVLTRGDGQELGQVRATPTCVSHSRINAPFEEAGESARQKSFTWPSSSIFRGYVHLKSSIISIFVSGERVSPFAVWTIDTRRSIDDR